ncbi:MAG TPA: MBL fold metallo-hydrolase, partial [Candidatus Lokiarchaeia archaeon]|nr:MBL fold metallo-hydrolase [Candidatus Lokiarchaeia archaeon]
MVDLTFYGGVGEIGGNKILLEADDTRIFLDFGQSFTFGSKFFAGWLDARTNRFGLRDYFALDLLPKIPGLFGAASLEPTDFPYQNPAFDAIFLTHVHYDHVAHLGFADEKIPVYLGATTKCMMQSWETTSTTVKFGERDYYTFRTGDIINVGNLQVEPIHVDHSTPAAYGYIIYTSQGAVVYTGDLRSHGPWGHMTRDFIDKARDVKPIATI